MMAEVLVTYETRVNLTDGPTYEVRACGRPLRENLWEGWLEFIPDDGSAVLRSGRETTQPNREDLMYWATGLEAVFLEGALRRALRPERPVTVIPPEADPAYEGPAPRESHEHGGAASPLDPFHIHESQGDEILHQQLEALEAWQLRNVVIAHRIRPEDAETAAMKRDELIEAIMDAVRRADSQTGSA
jgi:hypothetical protein